MRKVNYVQKSIEVENARISLWIFKKEKRGSEQKKKKKKKKLRKIEGQNVDKINRTIYGKILDGERKREREKKW